MQLSDRINPIDVEATRQQFESARPFTHVVLDNFLQPDFAKRVADAYPSYEDARKLSEIEFKWTNEAVKLQVTDSTKFPDPVQELHEALASPEWLETVSGFTGIPKLLADPKLRGSGMHLMGTGGRLDVHCDFNHLPQEKLHRRVNIILFLNKRWENDWGGVLDLWERDMKTCANRVQPIFNRAVIFATTDSSFHGVTQIRCPDDIVRCSFAGFYYTQAPPVGIELFTETRWQYRPDEWWRKIFLAAPESAYRRAFNVYRRTRRGVGRIARSALGRRQ